MDLKSGAFRNLWGHTLLFPPEPVKATLVAPASPEAPEKVKEKLDRQKSEQNESPKSVGPQCVYSLALLTI